MGCASRAGGLHVGKVVPDEGGECAGCARLGRSAVRLELAEEVQAPAAAPASVRVLVDRLRVAHVDLRAPAFPHGKRALDAQH